jgi:hypothetical protein
MADSSQGWRYPQPAPYPQGPAAPDSAARPPRPTAMRRAVPLMYAGAAIAVVNGIVDGLTMQLTTVRTYASPTIATVHSGKSLAAGVVMGLIVGGVWLWMALKTGDGRNWARVLSTFLFGFACLQVIGSITTLVRSGTVLAFIVFLVEWGVGLAALLLLWRRESSEFFASAN